MTPEQAWWIGFLGPMAIVAVLVAVLSVRTRRRRRAMPPPEEDGLPPLHWTSKRRRHG